MELIALDPSGTAAAALKGFAIGLTLILAIGAQNAFVLQMGLARQHVFLVSTICFVCDAALISVGVAGVGAIVSENGLLRQVAAWGGVIFLALYGLRSFRSALTAQVMTAGRGAGRPMSARMATASTLAVSLLNPHVYLDTVLLVGAVGSTFQGEARVAYGAGAVLASAVFFYTLGFGARLLAPLFAEPLAWRVLDVLIGLVMWWIAYDLLRAFIWI